MEQSLSWEANRLSADQIIPRILWNPKVHYRSHKCPSPAPTLREIDPVHSFKTHFLKIHFIIILPSTPGSSRWSLSCMFSHQNPVCASSLSHTRYVARLSHSSWYDHPNNTGLFISPWNMLENLLMPQLNEDSNDYIFQQDGSPAHNKDVRGYLKPNLPQRWIGRTGKKMTR